MGRISAVRREDRSARLIQNLSRYGVREPSARRVARVFEERGSGAALVELYKLGWRVCRKADEEGAFLLVRGRGETVGEEELEERDAQSQGRREEA